MPTVEDVRDLALTLPRTHEALVRDRVKFRVGRIVYLSFSRDEALIAAFNSGADLHCATASQMLGVPLDQVTPEQRGHAKSLNYGLI